MVRPLETTRLLELHYETDVDDVNYMTVSTAPSLLPTLYVCRGRGSRPLIYSNS